MSTSIDELNDTSPSPSIKQEQNQQLCRFFVLHGQCRYGDTCQFSHEGCAKEEAGKQIPCKFFFMGNCRFGEHCKLRHDEKDFQLLRLHENDDQITCGICWENVKTKKNDNNNDNHKNYANRFGLLLNCNHCFCYGCIQEWRRSKSCQKEVTKACPTCRQLSDFVVPSNEFYTGDEKERFIQNYKQRLNTIPCKMFNGTIGSCPFGPICLYAHRGPNGDDLKSMDIKKVNPNRRRRRHYWHQLQQQMEDEILLNDFNTFMSFLVSYSGHDELFSESSDQTEDDDDGDDDNSNNDAEDGNTDYNLLYFL